MNFPKAKKPKKLRLSHSSMKTWMECRRMYYFQYLAKLVGKRMSVPLFVGIHFHEGLEAFYKGEDPEEFIPARIKKMEEEVKKASFLTPEEEETLMIQSAVMEGMLYAYCRRYAKDRKKWKIIDVESWFELEVDDETELVGKIDMLVKIGKEYWLVEHKTASRLDKGYIDRLPVDTQITAYAIGAKSRFNKPIAGIIYNVVKKPSIRQRKNEEKHEYANRIVQDYMDRPEFYFFREQLYRDVKQEDEYKDEVRAIGDDIHDAMDTITKKNNGKEIPTQFYRNTAACTRFWTCTFLPICTRGWNKSTKLMYGKREEHKPFNTEPKKLKKL